MGLILPQTVKVKIGSINYKYYKEKVSGKISKIGQNLIR